MERDFYEKWRMFVAESVRITIRYFKAKILISVILGVVAGGIFSLLHIPYYGLWGVLFCAGNLVPIFGSWLATILICLVLLFIKPMFALYAFFVIMGLQLLEQFVLTPVIMGQAIRLRPLLVLGVVLVAGIFAGFWGMIFALPIAASIKAGYDIFFLNKYFPQS